jgi:hypothetical protein
MNRDLVLVNDDNIHQLFHLLLKLFGATSGSFLSSPPKTGMDNSLMKSQSLTGNFCQNGTLDTNKLNFDISDVKKQI